jgi:hypothetical protein
VTSVDDILHGCDELDEHQRDYEIANEYFDGTRPEFFASIRMKRLLQKTGTSFRTNIAKKAVTAVTDRLEISSIRAEPKEATAVVEDAWDANELDVEMPIALRKTCTLGDGYFFVWPNEDETGVDIEFSGPLTTRAIYDPEHPRRMKYVIKRWTTGTRREQADARQPLLLRQGRRPGREVGDARGLEGNRSGRLDRVRADRREPVREDRLSPSDRSAVRRSAA